MEDGNAFEAVINLSFILSIFAGVGKTSIISRFLNGTFCESYIATTEDTYK